MEKIIQIDGMHCNSCAEKIEEALRGKVYFVKASFSDEVVKVFFDQNKISLEEITSVIRNAGYSIRGDSKEIEEAPAKTQVSRFSSKAIYFHIAILSVIVLVALYVTLGQLGINLELPGFDFSNMENASIALLFFAGLLTGFHCIAMCGGFMVSYTAKNAINGHKSFYQHLVYGASKTLSYTIGGLLFGLIGSIFFFTPGLRGGIAVLAGIFMIFYARCN